MKNILFITLLFVAFGMNAQVTPITMITATKTPAEFLERNVALNFPYLGWKVAYNLNGDVSDNDAIALSARTMVVAAQGDRWALPFLVDVADRDSTVKTTTSIGAFPYLNIGSSNQLQLYAHSGLDYRINAGDVDDEFRILAGLQASLYPLNGGLPYSLSVAPEYKWFVNDADRSTFSLNITGVIPIVNTMGVLFQGGIPLDDNTGTAFEAGVIMNWQVKQ